MKKKILLLNSRLDRETPDYNAIDFVKAIEKALSVVGDDEVSGDWSIKDYL